MEMFVFIYMLYIIICSDVQSNPTQQVRIVNGQTVNIKNYNYQVSVLYGGYHICGGSILKANFVLTAAHCTHNFDHSDYSVHVGDTNIEGTIGGQIVKVKQILEHGSYNSSSFDYDLALLKLKSNLILTPNVQTITLASSEPKAGAIGTVTGWGNLWEGGPTSNTLQKVEVPIMDRNTCKKYYSGRITDRMICGGYTSGKYDACQGDSGGPLVVNGRQVGVVSWGIGCARAENPGVYSNIAKLKRWIENNIK